VGAFRFLGNFKLERDHWDELRSSFFDTVAKRRATGMVEAIVRLISP
jgi:hypothetical protein